MLYNIFILAVVAILLAVLIDDLRRLSLIPRFSLWTKEPQHEISNNVVCATSKASDQPAHMRSLIRAFASHLNIL